MRLNEFAPNKQGVTEGITESRGSLFSWLKQQFPTWPDYVVKDFLYQQAKTITSQEQLADFLEIQKKDFGKVKWRLENLPITLDIFTPKTQRMIKSREGGSSNPFQVPKDAERHTQQLKMIQQHGVRTEPIIVAKLNNGYDLIEGWHRTIQHLQQYPEGYTGPAWVAYGATYTSESKQGVAEGKFRSKDIEEFIPPNDALDDFKSKYLPDWEMLDHRTLQAKYVAQDHRHAQEFTAWINNLCEKMDHFAEVTQDVAEVTVKTTTFDVKGLTILDFKLAMAVDKYAESNDIEQVRMSGNFGMHQ